VGIATAYTLGKLHNKPVIEVNHIMGHVFSVLVERSLESIELPYVCLTVSGGHNDLYLVTNEKLKVKNEKYFPKRRCHKFVSKNGISPNQNLDRWWLVNRCPHLRANKRT